MILYYLLVGYFFLNSQFTASSPQGKWIEESDNCSIQNGKYDLFGDTSPMDDCSFCPILAGRETSFTKSEQCQVSPEFVKEIMKVLCDTLFLLNPPGRFSQYEIFAFCKVNQTETTFTPVENKFRVKTEESCGELLDEMEHLINGLYADLSFLVNHLLEGGDLGPIVIGLRRCINCLTKRIDDILKAHELELGDLEMELSNLTQYYEDIVRNKTEKILAMQKELHQQRLELVGAHIGAGNIVEAVILFESVNSPSEMEPLVEKLYGKVDFGNLLTFSLRLSNTEVRTKMYSKVYYWMDQLNDFSSTNNGIIFKRVLKEELDRCCGLGLIICCSKNLELFGLINLADIKVNAKVNEWARTIQSGKFNLLIQFGSDYSKTLAGNGVEDIMDKLITKAYNNTAENFHNVLQFIIALRRDSQRQTAFSTLLPFIKESKYVFKFGYELKNSMDNLLNLDPGGQNYCNFNNTKYSLPVVIRSIVWHTSCKMSAVIQQRNFTHGNITEEFSIHGGAPTADEEWKFERIEKNGEFEFKLRSANNYLSPFIPWKNSGDRYGVLSLSQEEHGWPSHCHNWVLENRPNETDAIAFYHLGRRSYLVSRGTGVQNMHLNLRGGGMRSELWKLDCRE